MEKTQVFHNGLRVWSVGNIDGNTFFGPFKGNVKKMIENILNSQELDINKDGDDDGLEIELESDDQIWMSLVPGPLSKRDPTLEMIRGPDDEIYLRTTRDILPREELRAWFSPSLERELGLLKHESNYTLKVTKGHCHLCDVNIHEDEDKYSNCHQSNDEMHYQNTIPSASPCSLRSSPTSEETSPSDNFKSAFRRFTNNLQAPFQNPKLASLISSFSHSRPLNGASSESLADYHKKEFRKKFQGNEHYLRKHLYREGMGNCSFVRYRGKEEHYIATTVSIQRPGVKFEKLQTSCYDNNNANKTGFLFRRGALVEERFNYRPEKHRIWNPFCSFSDDVKKVSEMSENTKGVISEEEKERERERISASENGNHSKQTRRDDDSKCDTQNDISMDSEEDDAKTEKDIPNKELSLDFLSKSHKVKLSTEDCHAKLSPRYFYNRPFVFQESMLPSMSIKDIHASTGFASLPCHQTIQPISIPFRINPGSQSRPRVTQGFTCDFCGKVYCRKYVLKIHMRTHTGFKPLKCKFCDKSFSDPSNMKKHVKLHETENTVHKCKHCGRNFVRYRGLLNHIKSKHTEPLNLGIIL